MVIVGGVLEGYFSAQEAIRLTRERLAAEASWAATFVAENEARLGEKLGELSQLPWGLPAYGIDRMRQEAGRLQGASPEIGLVTFLKDKEIITSLDRGAGSWHRDLTAMNLADADMVSRPPRQFACGPIAVDREARLYSRCTVISSYDPKVRIVVQVLRGGLSQALSRINVSRETLVTVFDGAGRPVAHSIPALLDSVSVLKLAPEQMTQRRWLAIDRGNGEATLQAFERSSDSQFLVRAEQSERSALRGISDMVLRVLLLLVAVSLGAAFLARLAATNFSRSLEALSDVAKKLAAGDMTARAVLTGNLEERQLALGFNEMARQLQSSYATLEAQVKLKTRDLAAANEQLALASQHKSDFLAHMSHELRTPLNAVIGFSEMLKAQYFGPLNDKQAEYVRDINASGQHLLSLINDILDLAKVEAGRMDLVRSHTAIRAVIDACCALVSDRAERKVLSLSTSIAPEVDVWMLDERKLKQCLLNLLSNAVKFTPEQGEISVHVRTVDDTLEVAVRDTGVGIAADDQARLFTEFFQATADRAQQAKEGTGLGLALTKRFVELHGGTITVSSQQGVGSEFTMRFPKVLS